VSVRLRERTEGIEDIPDYENYDYESEWRGRGIQDRAERSLVSGWVEPGESCLELGGGFGRLTSVLEPKFEKVFMIDFSRRNLSRASERLTKTRLIRTSISKIPFEDCTFDSVVAVRVLHHIPRLAEAIQEMVRVSRDGACIVLGVPNTRRLGGPAENRAVARGPQGHRIYAAPMSAYANPLLERMAMRGLGLFDNRMGRALSSLGPLYRLDVATSSIWAIRPQVFMKLRVRKEGWGRAPFVICRCGGRLGPQVCSSCGRSYGRIVDLAGPEG
jgi:ubiquinone/menaquinone biosynthesis C-methylase UbiE